MASLFDEIGGSAAIEAAVSLLYTKIISDPEINGFFDDVDITAQHGKMEKFLRMAFTGKTENADIYMRQAHKNLVVDGLNDHHFDRVAGHLKAVLEELGVAAHLREQVLAAVEGLRDSVLNRATVIDLVPA